MLRFLIAFVFVLLFLQPAASIGEDVFEIQWENLIPSLPAIDDPLAGLSEEEKGTVEWVIYVRTFLANNDSPEYQEARDEMRTVLAELKEKGLGVDSIIAERQYRNSAINTELDGQVVKLAGYLLPLDLSGDIVTEFLLVPFVGACIHSPPPPPNQIVSAVSATPQPYQLEKLYEPVWITGRLMAKSVSKELFLSDGSSDIDVGYSMSVTNIESFK